MKRWILAITLTAFASLSLATGEYLEAFLSHYKIKEDSPLGMKSCGGCHVSDEDFAFNPYGEEMAKAIADKGATELDGALLASLEASDADKDGTSNGAEILAGTFPGDPTSGAAPGKEPPPVTQAATKKPTKLVPKNGYHPAIVHFPIALFIGGLILDFFGMLRRDKTLLQAGWYNIVLAAVTAVGGILSGMLAMNLQKLPYRGLLLDHMMMAVGSSLIMVVMILMRVHRHEKMHIGMRVIYYALAVTCFAMISWAGHLGGVFVYGE